MTTPNQDWGWLDGLSAAAQAAVKAAGYAREQDVAEAVVLEQLTVEPAIAEEIKRWLNGLWEQRKQERHKQAAVKQAPARADDGLKVLATVCKLTDEQLREKVLKEATPLVKASPDGVSTKFAPRVVWIAHAAYELCRRAMRGDAE